MLYAALLYIFAIGVFLGHAWRQRHDVWIYTSAAPCFLRGEVADLSERGGPSRCKVLRVTRSALLVRPL